MFAHSRTQAMLDDDNARSNAPSVNASKKKKKKSKKKTSGKAKSGSAREESVGLGNTSHDVQRVRCLTHQCSDTETQLPVQCEDGRWYGSRCAAGCSGQTRCAAQDLPSDAPPEVLAAVTSGTDFTPEEHDALTRTNKMLMERSGAPSSTMTLVSRTPAQGRSG